MLPLCKVSDYNNTTFVSPYFLSSFLSFAKLSLLRTHFYCNPLDQLCSAFGILHGAFNPNFESFSPNPFGHIKVNFLIRYYSTHGIVVTTFVNSFTNSFLVICSDGLVICCGLLELMWARYSFEWFRLVFTRALIPCLTLRVLPQLTWIEEFPLVCSPILVLYPHSSKASITLQLLKVPLHHSKCVFLHVSCCCSNVRDQARAPSFLPLFVQPTYF